MFATPADDPPLLGLSDATCGRLAWLVWLLAALGLSIALGIDIARRPDFDAINGVYARASTAWWERRDLYDPASFHGFLYLPQAAILYSPLSQGDVLVRNLAERLLMLGILVAGLTSVVRLAAPGGRGKRALLLSVATVSLEFQNFRQGQFNPALTGLLLWAVAEIVRRRWGWAAVALSVAVAVKPLSLVLVLLAGALHLRTLGWRLALGLLIVAAFPFAFGPPGYVLSQYQLWFEKMRTTDAPLSQYYDLRGLLVTGLGLAPSQLLLTVLRVLAGLALLIFSVHDRRRRGPPTSDLALYVGCATYLMLFNPKNEDPTYLLLGPAIGIVLVQAWEQRRPQIETYALAGLPFLIAFSWEIWGGVHGGRRYWFRPLLALLFLLYALWRATRVRSKAAPGASPEAA